MSGTLTQFGAPSSFLEEGQLSRVMMFSRVGRHLPGKGTKVQVQLQWLLGCPCWPSGRAYSKAQRSLSQFPCFQQVISLQLDSRFLKAMETSHVFGR